MQFQTGPIKFRFLRIYNRKGQKVDTICLVKFTDYPRLGWAFAGRARLHPIDCSRFDKGVGKLVALRDALDNMDASSTFRKNAEETLVNNLPKPLPTELPTGVSALYQ